MKLGGKHLVGRQQLNRLSTGAAGDGIDTKFARVTTDRTHEILVSIVDLVVVLERINALVVAAVAHALNTVRASVARFADSRR